MRLERSFLSLSTVPVLKVGSEMLSVYLSPQVALAATEGTALALSAAGLAVRLIHKVNEGVPHVLDRIGNNEFDLIINTTASRPNSHQDSLTIRRLALMHNVTYFTTLAAARAACDAHGMLREDVSVNRLQSLHRRIDQAAGSVNAV